MRTMTIARGRCEQVFTFAQNLVRAFQFDVLFG